MPVLIPITGIDQNFLVPGNYAEILFAQGPATAAAPSREVVLAMPMLASGGSWTAGTLYQVFSEQDVITGAGAGSPIHRAARIFLRGNKVAKLWCLPVAASSGAGLVSASVQVTVATVPTAAGTATISFGPDNASYSFTTSDTVSTIATALSNAVNAMTWLGWSASPAGGVVTLTAKIGGASQYSTSLNGSRPIRVAITAGVGTTIALGSYTQGVDGATTEAANLATALANINAVRKYYIVVSSFDSTSLGNLKTHITNKSLPQSGLRSVGIAAFNGLKANAITAATTQNYTRLQLAWQQNSEFDTAELAGQMAAIRHLKESVDTANNFDGYRTDGWQVPAQYNTADWPTGQDQSDAINAGLAPIASDNVGSYLVMSTTTRSKNDAGTVNDRRALQSHRVSVSDDFTDTWLSTLALNFANKKLVDDDRLADGTINNNQRLIPGVVRPSMLVGSLKKLVDEFVTAGKLQDPVTSKASIKTNKLGGRVELGIDLRVIDWLDQTTTRVAEISTG